MKSTHKITVRKLNPAREQAIDDALALQLISIRLQKDLVEDLKTLAKNEGIGYQPFIRQVLTRFVRDTLKGRGRLRIANHSSL